MLKKHLKKIVSLVLVTMMAIGMSITAIAAEPYQNELEAVMDTSLADSGQVTHYDFYKCFFHIMACLRKRLLLWLVWKQKTLKDFYQTRPKKYLRKSNSK